MNETVINHFKGTRVEITWNERLRKFVALDGEGNAGTGLTAVSAIKDLTARVQTEYARKEDRRG